MAGMPDKQMADIDAIDKLKARYWHCIDNKMWQEVVHCFAEDAVADYPNGTFRGREAIAKSFKDTSSPGPVAHVGHRLGIETISDITARGSWQAEVSMTDPNTASTVRFHTAYEDEYVKDKGQWVIQNSKMRLTGSEKPGSRS